jgi:hypothetical protein
MRCDPLYVFHKGYGVLEDIVIDALQHVAKMHTCLIKDHAIRVIDVAAAVGCGAHKIAANFKLPRHNTDITLSTHNQSLSG